MTIVLAFLVGIETIVLFACMVPQVLEGRS
jgi:hypothetical protein